MVSQPVGTEHCLEAMGQHHAQLVARLDDLAIHLREAATAHARRELFAWCAFAAVVSSVLIVLAVLIFAGAA